MSPEQGPEPNPASTVRIRLSPSASVTPTQEGVILRSDLGTFQIEGPDIGAFLTRMVPLLDGSRDEAAILASLAEYSPPSVTAFLGLLRERGLIEPVAPAEAPRRGADAFFRTWRMDPAEAADRLRRARVLVAGLEPWGAAAAIELAIAGVGALHLVDDGLCAPGDAVHSRGRARPGNPPSRREALSARLADEAPWCHVETGGFVDLDGDAGIAAGPWTLLVAAVPPDDGDATARVSRFAHRAGIVSLWSHVAGTTLVLGPVVTPGKTACRVCAAAEGLNPLPARSPAGAPSRGAPGTAAMEQLLGHMVAMEVIVQITKYTPSSLGGRLLLEDRRTLETSRHTLVRLPWCPVCGDR
jgi:molybdopterin-synthase adenylyltransferase